MSLFAMSMKSAHRAAKEDFPDMRTYNRIQNLLEDEAVDLVANVLPSQCTLFRSR